MKSKLTVTFLTLSLTIGQAHASSINWSDSGAKVSYGTLATGIVLAGTGAAMIAGNNKPGGAMPSLGVGTTGLLFIVVGGAVAVSGLGGLVSKSISDTLSGEAQAAELLAAEHRSVLRHSRATRDDQPVGTNLSFNHLMSLYSCSDCRSDSEKQERLAQIILEMDGIAGEIFESEITPDTEKAVYPDIANALKGDLKKDAPNQVNAQNFDLARFLVAQSVVDKKLKTRQ